MGVREDTEEVDKRASTEEVAEGGSGRVEGQ
jgi:hypothetical protein